MIFTLATGDNQTCIGDEVMADCYESCWEQNQCGRCNWSGCYDERLFIFSVIEELDQKKDLKGQEIILKSNADLISLLTAN